MLGSCDFTVLGPYGMPYERSAGCMQFESTLWIRNEQSVPLESDFDEILDKLLFTKIKLR